MGKVGESKGSTVIPPQKTDKRKRKAMDSRYVVGLWGGALEEGREIEKAIPPFPFPHPPPKIKN